MLFFSIFFRFNAIKIETYRNKSLVYTRIYIYIDEQDVGIKQLSNLLEVVNPDRVITALNLATFSIYPRDHNNLFVYFVRKIRYLRILSSRRRFGLTINFRIVSIFPPM